LSEVFIHSDAVCSELIKNVTCRETDIFCARAVLLKSSVFLFAPSVITILFPMCCLTSVKDVHTLPGADIDSDHNLRVAKICTRLKKIVRFQKRRPRWDLQKLYTQRQRVQDTLEEKLGATGSESGNVEVQWNNIGMCVGYYQ
jgi:hypothetical protein